MSQLIVTVATADNPDNPDELTEIWRRPMPSVNLDGIEAEHHLDCMEKNVEDMGWDLMKTLLVEQWRFTDQELVAQYRNVHEIPEGVTADGYDALKVVSRFGVIQLPRQVCFSPKDGRHVLPGNAALPEHNGQVTTRGVQEWACLLPQNLPFATAQRLLGWMTHDPKAVSETQVRRWVARHGEVVRDSEQAEAKALLERKSLEGLKPQLAPVEEPRRSAAWDATLNESVEAALSSSEQAPPEGVSEGDWERVVQVRREEKEAGVEALRHQGPKVRPGEVVASTDDVQVRRPEKDRWLQIRTACVRTSDGLRYLSGSAASVLQQLFVLLLLCGGTTAKLTLLGDGAKWIANFFTGKLAEWCKSELVVDWYHLSKKCYQLTSMICRGLVEKRKLFAKLLFHLWRGKVEEAIKLLEAYRSEAKNKEVLEKLIKYLRDRRDYLPSYKERRAQRRYIGSGHTEKANDFIVARRQKHKGMHWSGATSDGLAALRTLMLNGGWDLYWQKNQVLPLAVPIPL